MLLMACFLSISGCHTKNYPAHNLPEEQLTFGKGGGFTGDVTKYILLKNGQLFQSSSLSGDVTEIGKVEKKQVTTLFKKADSLGQVDFNHPGNYYYFITRKLPGKESTVIWGSPEDKIPSHIQELYDALNKLIRANK